MLAAMILRDATMDDAARLFAWRNDTATRAASHTTGELAFDDHCKWLSKSLAMTTRQIFIADINGTAVGTVRLDKLPDCTELSWTVAPEHRGRGHGTAMVRAALAILNGPACATIKAGNVASQKIARKIGMRLEQERDGVLHFRCP
jgi:RimJ/RimL family protein N-acetyltransferase